MRKDNHGFTVVELLVVIAIVVILTTGISLGMNSVSNANVNKVAKTVDAQMKRLRLVTMSKEESYSLFLYRRGNTNYYEIAPTLVTDVSILTNGTKLGKTGLKIQYTVIDNNSLVDVGGDKFIKITYDQANGTFKTNYNKIQFVSGEKTKQIILASITGRHFIR